MQPKKKNPATKKATGKRGTASPAGLGTLVAFIISLGVIAVLVVIFTYDYRGKKGSGLSSDFIYDISKQKKVDPALIWYYEADQIQTNLNENRGIAVGPDNRIYVAGDRSILIFDEEGRLTKKFPLPKEPLCVTVSKDKVIWVGFLSEVAALSFQGKQIKSWKIRGSRPHITSLAVEKDFVAVADAGDRIVLLYNQSGEFIREIGRRDPERNIPGFFIPSPYMDVAFSSDGLLRVANTGMHLIEAYTLRGDRELAWGKPGTRIDRFCGCCNPVHFAIMPDGAFVTSEKGLVRVKIYEPDGRFRCVVAPPSLFKKENLGRDVAVDKKGRILVLDPPSRSVRVFLLKKNAKNANASLGK